MNARTNIVAMTMTPRGIVVRARELEKCAASGVSHPITVFVMKVVTVPETVVTLVALVVVTEPEGLKLIVIDGVMVLWLLVVVGKLSEGLKLWVTEAVNEKAAPWTIGI